MTARRGEARALRREERLKVEEEAKAALAIEAAGPAADAQEGGSAAKTGEGAQASSSSPSSPSAGGKAGMVSGSSGIKTETGTAPEENPAKKLKTKTSSAAADKAAWADSLAFDEDTAASAAAPAPPSSSSPPPHAVVAEEGTSSTKPERSGYVSEEEREGRGASGAIPATTVAEAAPTDDDMNTETVREVIAGATKPEPPTLPTRAAGGTSHTSQGAGLETEGNRTAGANKREREAEAAGDGGGTAKVLKDGSGARGAGGEGEEEHRAAKR